MILASTVEPAVIEVKPKMWFFGSIGRGHCLYREGSSYSEYKEYDRFMAMIKPRYLDTGLAPSDKVCGGYEIEGVSMITWHQGHTFLAFWDRSGDRRYASNACLIADQTLSFSQVYPCFLKGFPDLFARMKYKFYYGNGGTMAEHVAAGDYNVI
jgi:hypothetical protein